MPRFPRPCRAPRVSARYTPPVDRSYLVLDIETVKDKDLAWEGDAFPPPPYHEVVALGALWLDPELRLKRLGVFGVPHDGGEHSPSEQRVLEDFAQFVGRARPHLVTYNGRGFDLPVLVHRCLKHGVPFGMYYTDRDYRYRYSELGHIDIADLLSDHGAARRTSLDSIARLIGLPGKLDVDGSMVEKMHEDGRIADIRAYCLQDVLQTAFVFLRCELLRGRIDRKTYCERARALADALGGDPRVKPVLDAADRQRLFLEASDAPRDLVAAIGTMSAAAAAEPPGPPPEVPGPEHDDPVAVDPVSVED